MTQITASVGRDGHNRYEDVRIIQKLINQNIGSIIPLRPLFEDGDVGPATINTIEEFQRRIVGLSLPDGRVDPNGRTWRALKKETESESAASNAPKKVYKVSYSPNLAASKQIVSNYAISVIQLALKKADMPQAVITSTVRTPSEQAAIMYKNARINLSKQFRLYGSTGDEVLKIFKANGTKPKPEVIKLMKTKIESLLKEGRRTSKHVVTSQQYNALNIIDIGVNSTRNVCGGAFSIEKFTQALSDLQSEGYIDKLIDETNKSNTCWHIEIIPNKKILPAEQKFKVIEDCAYA